MTSPAFAYLRALIEDPLSNFKQLGLSDTILEVLEQIGFENPTEIQEKAIPLLLENEESDFIGLAQTGTGKTAAFGLPLLDLLDPGERETQALIMAPTRELGQQIARQLEEFSKNNSNINIVAVYGGANIATQIKALRHPTQVVVATPGRLLDLIRRRAVHLDHVRHVVLDEADEMLNMGFKEDIDQILDHTNEDRSIWLFSATMPPAIRRIVQKYMDSPLEAIVNAAGTSNKDITHQFTVVKGINKLKALRRFLDIYPEMRGVLFCRTKRETEQIAEDLNALGYNVGALNGDMSQQQRDRVMKMFKKRSMQLLIATDVAARGIDVKDLSHVIHHSLPDQMEYYTHRSGRTGRAGNKGISLSFIGAREIRKIGALEHHLQVKFERVLIPNSDEVLQRRIAHWADFVRNITVHEQADQILEGLEEKFADLDKDDLLRRLVSTQMDHLLSQDGSQEDLNVETGIRKKVKPKVDLGDSHRFYINLGMIDGLTKADLVNFLSDVSGVKRKYIQNISLLKNCAYFNVDASKSKGFGDTFAGIEMDGRPLRVNRDHGSAPSHKKRSDHEPRKFKANMRKKKRGKGKKKK